MVELPDSIKKKTTECTRDFECLATRRCGTKEICKGTLMLGPNLLQLATNENLTCAYHIRFGYAQMCLCPVRCYLHSLEHPDSN